MSAITDFPTLFVEPIFDSLSCSYNSIDLLLNPLSLSTHILFGLGLDSSKIALVIVTPFLSFKRATHAYLL